MTMKIIQKVFTVISQTLGKILKFFGGFLLKPVQKIIAILLISAVMLLLLRNCSCNPLWGPLFRLRVETAVSGHFQGYKDVDMIFCAFAYVPIIDVNTGYTKSQLFNPFYDGPPVTLGYCIKEYEVSIGYDNVMNILEIFKDKDQITENEVPDPKILAINPVTSKVRGKYLQSDCDAIDLDPEGRMQIIMNNIGNDQWMNLCQQSRKVLLNYLELLKDLNKMDKEI